MESIGNYLILFSGYLSRFIQLSFNIVVAAFVLFLLLRWLADALQINPFGKIVFQLRRLTNDLIFYTRTSRVYVPLKQALGFDPSYLLAVLGLGLIWFLVPDFLGSIPMVIWGIGSSLLKFAEGETAKGMAALIGSLLLGVIFFLMLLMTILFINWLSGAFGRMASLATHRLAPLLRIFDFGGVMAGWSFPLMWIVLYFASGLVRSSFFRP